MRDAGEAMIKTFCNEARGPLAGRVAASERRALYCAAVLLDSG